MNGPFRLDYGAVHYFQLQVRKLTLEDEMRRCPAPAAQLSDATAVAVPSLG